jgi:hypothetical protein
MEAPPTNPTGSVTLISKLSQITHQEAEAKLAKKKADHAHYLKKKAIKEAEKQAIQKAKNDAYDKFVATNELLIKHEFEKQDNVIDVKINNNNNEINNCNNEIKLLQLKIVENSKAVKALTLDKSKLLKKVIDELMAKPNHDSVETKVVQPNHDSVETKVVQPNHDSVETKVVQPNHDSVETKVVQPVQPQVVASTPKPQIKVVETKVAIKVKQTPMVEIPVTPPPIMIPPPTYDIQPMCGGNFTIGYRVEPEYDTSDVDIAVAKQQIAVKTVKTKGKTMKIPITKKP